MRKLAAIAVVLSIGACATRSSQRVGYGVGGTIAAVGVIVTAGSLATGCEGADDYGCGLGKGLGVSMGISTALLGALILTAAAASNPPPDPPEPALAPPTIAPVPGSPIPTPPTTNPQLVRLTKQASVMARRDQCEGVIAVAREVAAIDAVYRVQGFVADPPIARCLPD